MKKINVITLGCSKNTVDSEHLMAQLAAAGYTVAADSDRTDARVVVVNTCGFIGDAKQESIDMILRAAAAKQAGRIDRLFVVGCLSERYADELRPELPEVDEFFGVKDWEGVVRALGGEWRSDLATERRLTTPRHYAYLKIGEGCDWKCGYCAIPLIRGPYVSKPYEQVLAEARDLAARGVKELIVVAQDTTVYGADLYGKLRLAELLKDLNDIDGIRWIRVMYMYPNTFTDELIEAFATLPKLCHYVDLPLQHASQRLLRAMNRHDSMAHTRELLAKLRKRIPDIVIRTTFIVGFPGETDEDFEELKRFVEEERFENAGVFTYSREEGTAAAEMPGQIPDAVKEDRYNELMAIQAGISEELHKAEEGKELEVVVEGYNEDGENLAEARSYREAPDIDGMIYVENAPGLKPGDFIRVRVDQGFDYDVVALRVD